MAITGSVAEPFGEDIWLLDGDRVRMFGIPFETRTCLVRLNSGLLWVHSPVALTPERLKAVTSLGAVGFIIAPNKIHSLEIVPWRSAFPEAQVWVSPRFHERHQEIASDGVLTDAAPKIWADDIQQQVFHGHRFLDEVVFLHVKSRTLIVTDLIQKHDPAREHAPWRWLKKWAGILGEKGGSACDLRASTADRDAARAARDKILSWDFDTLVISHGLCLRSGAKAEVERALAWLDR